MQIKPYVPPQTKKPVGGQEEEQESSQSSDLEKGRRSQGAGSSNPYSSTDPNGKSNNAYQRQEFPNGKKATIDYSKSKVNIAQILTDFKNTATAIGSPPNIVQEVESYLAIAEGESLKSEPNKKRIQSTLKNASNVLDEFISKTLNKKSKVVENWIDALFLQQVNYKSDPTTVNEDFLVKLPDKETGDMKPISTGMSEQAQAQKEEKLAAENPAVQSSELPEETPQTNTEKPRSVYIPQDAQVRKAFLQGKKYASINQTDKALEAFQSALAQAQAVNDDNAAGMICFEMGQIYDRNDDLELALNFYNQAHESTSDNNLKAKAYYSMAQIYDDVVYFEPAMNHYFAAISFAGESENLNAQTRALSDIADMYAERYDIENTYTFYGAAKNIALETKNNKTLGATWSRSADALTLVSENVNALQDYKASSQFYEQADSPLKMARNYEKASAVMLKLGNKTKAQSLLEKARKLALNASDTEYADRLQKQLNVF